MIVVWIILFIPAGSIKYWEAWIFWIGFSLITFFITVYFTKNDPELLSRRTKHEEKETTKKAPAILKLYYIGFILPGLDFRFHWSNDANMDCDYIKFSCFCRIYLYHFCF